MISLSSIAVELFKLAQEIADFADEATERLDFGEYADLMEYESKLLAYGNLLSTKDRTIFLREEIDAAAEHLRYLRWRTGGAT